MVDPREDDWTDELLPNGYSRQECYEACFSDIDIEYCGLVQSGVPDPKAIGFVIMDFLDSDGERD